MDAVIHPTPSRKSGPPNAQDVVVAPRQKFVNIPLLIIPVLASWSLVIAAYSMPSGMAAKEAGYQILKCHIDNHYNCGVSY